MLRYPAKQLITKTPCRSSFHIMARHQMAMKPGHGGSEESPLATAFKGDDASDDDRKAYQAQNPEIPSLRGLSKRWNKMDAFDQDQVINYLDDKSRGDWKLLTTEERQAMWFVNFGPWGPRDPNPYDPSNIYLQLSKLIGGVIIGVSGYKLYKDFGQANSTD